MCGTQVRSDWESVKIDVMYRALKCKFSIYPHLNSMLLSTAGSVLVEASPHDLFWGGGREGEGEGSEGGVGGKLGQGVGWGEEDTLTMQFIVDADQELR